MKKNKKIFIASVLSLIFLAKSEAVLAAWNPDELSAFNLPSSSIFNIVTGIFFWLLAIIGIVAMISFAISGVMYLTAAGNENQIERAKRTMTYSIIGVIVGLSGFVVLQAVMYMLSGSYIF